MKFYFYVPLFLLIFSSLLGAEKNPLPRFVSLRPNEVNSRVGPGPDYPIEWIYLKAGLPVEVTAEFDTWRKIRDVDHAEGWVHQSMLCSKRRAIIQGEEVLMYGEEGTKNHPLVRLQHGVVVDLLKCHGDWCQVRIYDFKGWVQRASLWGIYPQETIG
ncbi:MAG TPA: SH3 domain-containing protein [Alphaproteobacteria bacterium]|nr:SH3 domain-containing protein [Alphaproteobacteria bacterium]